ncbi:MULTISPECIES: sulfatase [Sphingobium]|uniref:sulfatase family protein n=1 Tax=Sphingobium TaxID=165695 RepID=UPI00159C32ED|nr:sulfatase-like hydrolase/transferase [Sphingobium sp. 15-1]
MIVSRRKLLAGLTAVATTGGVAWPVHGASRDELPNIVFIMADDLGYGDLGCTGARDVKTPYIDSLAENGMLLRHGYANSSVCSPTRTALLTGCYQYRFPIGLEEPLGLVTPDGIGVPAERRTIAEVLRAQGYETALVGKWHLGHAPGSLPLAQGYDHFFGIIHGGADYFRHHSVMGGKDIGSGLFDGNKEIERVGYMTDLFGDEAVTRIRKKTKPLFLSLHFTAPHWPWEGREDEEEARRIKDFFHYDGGTREVYTRMIAAMDDNVGKVLSTLRELGELDNTIIVFTSDNGGERFSDVWPFTGMKGELLEGGIRTPILFQWPRRIARGRLSDQVMMSMDFLPTLLSIAGGSWKAGEFDGADLSSHLIGAQAPIDRTLFWRMKSHEQAAVRDGKWKYLRLGGKEHLFDIVHEPRERAVLNDKFPDKLQELRIKWDAWNCQMLPYPISSYSADNKLKMPDRY